MIGRIIWYAALIALALLATALQIDKQAETTPAVARFVPAPLRNFAQTRVTQAALEQGDPAVALAEAERLVRRRPLPAEYLTLLAIGQAKAGQAERAAATIQLAARRGWRDPVAQEAMLRLALANADRREAARRYAALFLNDRTPDALLLELGPAVLDGPDTAARDTLVAIVVGGERWHPAFLRRGARVMPPAAFAAIAADSLARGATFDCRALQISLDLLGKRDAAAAAQLRTAADKRCPKLRG
ncbi:tetratricopeptide repeat protein [Erythrobacter donghaensis]|uniref:tetratricopeptide repeat protein n=1 Tax=Erythrobacter donghaensis TaxID=267135 RepID=UPI000940412D|nr:tetratricopeptide repeat protein [Erythrobacter donghaensis]